MGKSLSSPERSERKIARLRARSVRNPNSAGLFQALGKTLLQLAYERSGSHFGDAEAAQRRSLELAPDDVWTHLYLANVFYALQLYRESLEAAKQGHELAPKLDMPLICMADAYAGLKYYVHADECYRKAVEVDPESEVARKNCARWQSFWLPEQERRRNAKAEGTERRRRNRDNLGDE